MIADTKHENYYCIFLDYRMALSNFVKFNYSQLISNFYNESGHHLFIEFMCTLLAITVNADT